MKTRDEVEALKRNWEGDACWDLEETEGFEEHREELRAHRLKCEERWREEARVRLEAEAAKLGLSSNLELARAVVDLRGRVERLEERTAFLEPGIYEMTGKLDAKRSCRKRCK